MVLITMITGFLMITGSVIAGFLMYSQLKGSSDAIESGMAVFAADAGVEKALYEYYKTENPFSLNPSDRSGGNPSLEDIEVLFANGTAATARLWCVGSDRKTPVDCRNSEDVFGFRVRSIGSSKRTERVLETFYLMKYN